MRFLKLLTGVCLLFVLCFYAFSAELTVQTTEGPYTTIPPTADSLDITFAAGSVTSSTFACTGRELIIIHNSGVGSATFTIDAVVDQYNRDGDVDYTLAAGEYASYWIGNVRGWKDTNGNVTLLTGTTDVEYAIVRIPTNY